jgi:hypothetical protein
MYEEMKTKVLVLNERLWEARITWPRVEAWLENFCGEVVDADAERLHALYLLTHFLYFGSRQIRELLRALYRDFVLYPILASVRSTLGGSRDVAQLTAGVNRELAATRFFGVGNPSESGTHLLYFFRQENGLQKDLFWETHKIFHRTRSREGVRTEGLREPGVKRYIFIDDLCGSGNQASDYSTDLVEDIRRLNPEAAVAYHPLFATSDGIRNVRERTQFTTVECLYELDPSYKTFSAESRVLADIPPQLQRDLLLRMTEHYGRRLIPDHCLGFEDGQLLVGFHHNTPDNTLPIIWFGDQTGPPWKPIFRRYPKIYDSPGIS